MQTNKLRVAFFGTSDKSTPIIQKLHENYDLCLCVTKTDRMVGRKQEIQQTQVKKWALENNIPLLEIADLKAVNKTKVTEQLLESKIDIGVVCDFKFIIPEEIINTPTCKLINVHFSLLPVLRGASPVQNAILTGSEKTGVSYFIMDKDMDTGNLIGQVEYKLNDAETAQILMEKLYTLAAQNIVETINNYVSGKIKPQEQNHNDATYTYSRTNPKSTQISKEDAKIDWNMPNIEIDRMIRAFNPWPIAWTTLKDLHGSKLLQNRTISPNKNPDLRLKIFSAEYDNHVDTLTNLHVQVEGSTKTTWENFLNGYTVIKSSN